MSDLHEMARAICEPCAQDRHHECEPIVTDAEWARAHDCRCLHDDLFDAAASLSHALIALQRGSADGALRWTERARAVLQQRKGTRGMVIDLGARVKGRAS